MLVVVKVPERNLLPAVDCRIDIIYQIVNLLVQRFYSLGNIQIAFQLRQREQVTVGIPHRLVGVIDHELVAVDGIGEIVGYGGQLHCAASAAVKGIGGRSVELPCACKCVRAAGAAFCQQYNANDDYRQCGDRTAKHHTALRLFFLPFSDSLYRSI